MKSHTFSKIVVSILTIAMLAPFVPVSVPRAHAIDAEIVLDIPRVAEQVLRHAAVVAAQQAVQSITRSMVNWINSGFNGSPGFETNLGISLRRLADGAASEFFGELENSISINSPFLNRIVGAVRQGYLLYSSREAIVERLRYTLNQFSPNDTAFRQGDFSQGGFDAWRATTFQCGNDPYCSEFSAQEELMKRIDSTVQQRIEELGWGRGFLSWRSCTNESGERVSLSDADESTKCSVRTPGAVVADQMSFLANQPALQLTVADSIDQILGALASQLISQVTGGAGGLLGANNPSSGSRSSNAGSTSSTASVLSNAFLDTVRGTRANVVAYQTGWQQIKDAALRAQQECATGGDTAMQAEVTQALVEVNAGATKATNALSALDTIITRATSAQTGLGSALTAQVTSDYQCLVSGGTPTSGFCRGATGATVGTTCPVSPTVLPSPSELSCVTTQARDSGSATPVSLLTRMNRIANSGCQ